MREDEPKSTGNKDDANYNFNNDINDELLKYHKSEDNFSKFFTQAEVNEGKLMACLSYLCIFAILPYLSDTTNRYIKFHAKQGMNLLILEMLATVGYIFLGFSLFQLIFRIIAFILFVYSALGIMYAMSGRAKKLPYLDMISVIK